MFDVAEDQIHVLLPPLPFANNTIQTYGSLSIRPFVLCSKMTERKLKRRKSCDFIKFGPIALFGSVSIFVFFEKVFDSIILAINLTA